MPASMILPAVLGASPPQPDLDSLVLVLLASTLGALFSRLHYKIVLPTVVVEIVLGILIGPQVLDIAKADAYITFLSTLGLAFLFFFIGLDVVEQKVPRTSLVRGTRGWFISVAIALVAGVVLQVVGVDAEWWVLGVALTTTTLGTLGPILSDAGLLPTPIGHAVLGMGVAGEFWPIVVISVFLTGERRASEEILLLALFGVVVALSATAALRARPPRVVRVLQETIHTTGQTAVRLSVFFIAVLALIAYDVGFDFVLGAMAAGLVVGLALDTPRGEPVRMRLEGIGFGFLIPIYFVVTGMNFDLDSLLTPSGLGLAVVFVALLLVVRGASALLWLRDLGSQRTGAVAFFGAAALPLVVAIVGIGMDRDAITSEVGASLVGAGMISVLVFPLVGLRLSRGEADTAASKTPSAPATQEAASS